MIRNLGFGSMLGACAVLLTSAGCSSDSRVDIGDGRLGLALSDYADVWDGYAEAVTFTDGSDRVRVTLDADGNGFLEIGDSPPPPPPTAGGPPPYFHTFAELIPGVAAPITGARVELKRLRLEAPHLPSFEAWCEEQPAVLYDPIQAPGVYSCFPNNVAVDGAPDLGGDMCRVTETSQVMHCNLPRACWYYCGCTASGCQAASTATPGTMDPVNYGSARLDAALFDGGDMLEGTLIGNFAVITGDAASARIRLERQ